MKTNSLTITYLSKVSFSSLNGSDKEVDNINPIKKVTLSNGEELPYVSSQAIRRALRDKIEELGNTLSPVDASSTEKGAPKTALDPIKYIDDDLFGFMDAQSGSGNTKTRTSPIRVESLLALATYKGDLDYATNFMGKKIGLDANIFETEIHSGVYRGTILIELDRVGKKTKIKNEETRELETIDLVDDEEKANRVIAFLNALQTLWSQGRQTRFLADISPKFIAAALMKSKNPIFLEAVDLTESGNINIEKLNTVVSDYEKFIESHVFAAQEAVFPKQENVESIKEGFDQLEKWVKNYYGV
ncbi:type I-B CRISPR-associated protein Cas7/Cst2/DevR [Rhodohalobacter halophilus]|uniref:type I-B CRISPR-associated protein Cas7/Cst2/DevR n=1 Tax=Rhodohalobacter halophilus TaxID=1812810 RepID=UPI00083FD240|nr:type I-B CRISPR-associated protein Cas7/Cst2/DevR [Rhodohalobacter halophilus]